MSACVGAGVEGALPATPDDVRYADALDDLTVDADEADSAPDLALPDRLIDSPEDALDVDDAPAELDAAPRDGADGDSVLDARLDTVGDADIRPPPDPCLDAADGTLCDDGDACSQGDRCVQGACLATAAMSCGDGDPCTDDFCLPASGCTFTLNFAACEDGDPCTAGESCLAGACVGGGPACDDANPCTIDLCDGPSGACTHPANDAATCSDGDECTGGDTCAAGVCLAGEHDGCDDDNSCTIGECLGVVCVSTVLDDGAACTDGDECTSDDVCAAGVCSPGPLAGCDDGKPCTTDGCVPATGCVASPRFAGPCDDGSVCTLGETCDETASCVPADVLACVDDNPCTLDGCDRVFGCKFVAALGPCEDGDGCTTGGLCQNTVCVSVPLSCDDGDACTLDTCDPVLGCAAIDVSGDCVDGEVCTVDGCDAVLGCTFAPWDAAPCDDGDACTDGDRCVDGACAPGVALCDDGDVCTQDLCDPEETCVYLAVIGPCDDGDPCTSGEVCDTQGECGGGEPVALDDGVDCTIDACGADLGIQHDPADQLCPPSRICDPTAGCVLPSSLDVAIERIVIDPGGLAPGPWLQLVNLGAIPIDLRRVFIANLANQEAALRAPSGDLDEPLILPPGERIAAIHVPAGTPVPAGCGARMLAGPSFTFQSGAEVLAVVEVDLGVLDIVAMTEVSSAPASLSASAFPAVVGASLDLGSRGEGQLQLLNDQGDKWCAVPGGAAEPGRPPVDCDRAIRVNEVALATPGDRWVELVGPVGASLGGAQILLYDAAGLLLQTASPVQERVGFGGLILLDDLLSQSLSAGAVRLVRTDGETLDTYGFGAVVATSVNTGNPLYEAAPGPAQQAGFTAARVPDGADTDDNSADFQEVEGGSPGAPNLASPPAP